MQQGMLHVPRSHTNTSPPPGDSVPRDGLPGLCHVMHGHRWPGRHRSSQLHLAGVAAVQGARKAARLGVGHPPEESNTGRPVPRVGWTEKELLMMVAS